MDHAVGALLVVAGAVGIPVGLLHQLLEGRRVAFAEQVAGLLPTEHGAGRVAPWRAMVGLVAGQEVEEQARLLEGPLLAALLLTVPEHAAEQVLGRLAVQEVLLVGGTLVGVARGDGDAVDAHPGDAVEEVGDLLGAGIVEEGAVDRDAEAHLLGLRDRRHGLVVDAALADRLVVHLLVAVEMDRPGEVRARLVLLDLLLKEERVRADDRELLLGDDALDDLRQVLVEQRLAAGDDHDGCAALAHGFERVGDRQPLVQDLVRIIDLAAARAGEIAAEQGLHHHHERVALATRQVLFQDVAADLRDVPEGDTQDCGSFTSSAPRRRGA